MIINQRVLAYVQDAISKGYDLSSIRTFLLKNNVPAREIDEILSFFQQQPAQAKQSVQSPASISGLDERIRQYINAQLASGYSKESIRLALLQQGIDGNIIDRAFGKDININVRHEHHIAGKSIAMIFVGIILISGMSIGSYMMFFSQSPLLDASIALLRQEFFAGESLSYQLELVSTGSKERFDVNARYIILDSDGKVKKSYSETIAVDVRTVSKGEIMLPTNLLSGIYTLKVVVDYAGKKAESETEFSIIKKVTSDSPITKDDTQEYPEDNTTSKNTHTSTPVTELNNKPKQEVSSVKSFGDVILLIMTEAKTRPESAASMCKNFQSVQQKDLCYSSVASASNNPMYCDRMGAGKDKDDCYLVFVLSGNTNLCGKIGDNSTKEFCDQMRIVSLMNTYYQQGNTEKILELNAQFKPTIYNLNPQPKDNTETYSEESTLSITDIMITASLETNSTEDNTTIELER